RSRVVRAFEEGAREEIDAGGYGRWYLHHHQSGWNWRSRVHTDCQFSGGGNPRLFPFAYGAGMDQREIRAAPDSAVIAFLRPPIDRWRGCGAIPALDFRSV